MEATMEAQATRIQELEVRVLEECQRVDASHAQFQDCPGGREQFGQELAGFPAEFSCTVSRQNFSFLRSNSKFVRNPIKNN